MFVRNLILAATAISTAVQADWVDEKYDAIVVGSGAGGSIATRMAEAGLKTLILENGGPTYGAFGGDLDARRPSWLNGTNLSRVDVPGLYKSIFSSNTDDLVPSPNGYAGNGVGGSTAINAGLFFLPPDSDWEEYFPAGWHAKDVEGAKKRLIARQPYTDTPSLDGKKYLQSGYDAARQWIVDSLGFNDVDINAQSDDTTAVFGHTIFDYANGQRSGPALTYLLPALQNETLDLTLQTGVNVIRVERTGNQTTGVYANITDTNTQRTISLSPNGIVILSAGALATPKLLMFSGIGDPDQLSAIQDAGQMEVRPDEWVNNTAVGEGLFDNINTFIELSGPGVESYVYSYDSPPPEDLNAYLQNRTGSYTFASETSVFWDTLTRDDGTVATFQGTIDSSGFTDFLSSTTTITLNIYGTSGMSSRGRVLLGPGPDFAPEATDALYNNTADLTDIAGFVYKILSHLPSSNLTSLNIPRNSTLEDIHTYITTPSPYTLGHVQHTSSSCAIGKCVDTNAKVVGMQGLYVADASIVQPMSKNPQAGVMIAAERVSELVLAARGVDVDGDVDGDGDGDVCIQGE